MVDPAEEIEYNGTTMSLRDVPDAVTRHLCGLGHSSWDVRHKERHSAPLVTDEGEAIEAWADDPEWCRRADETKGVWINGGQNLVCPGCGLDFT